jgi:hypothetical protein
MTFNHPQKLVRSSQSNLGHTKLLERLANKPFWIWDIEKRKRADIRTKGDYC